MLLTVSNYSYTREFRVVPVLMSVALRALHTRVISIPGEKEKLRRVGLRQFT